jgi:predicted lipoprotein with Yx(FWY)xxD motif
VKKRMYVSLVSLALVAAACGGEGAEETTTTTDDTTTTTAAETTTTAAETTTTAAEEATTTEADAVSGVHAADTDLGLILVDPDGFTLYIFTVDTEGESACYDACADLWPPVPADTPISSDLDASIFGSAPRTDGLDQLTVNGMPLYLYTPDTSPGDTSGHGFNDVWFVVDAGGEVIEASGENAPIDYGY